MILDGRVVARDIMKTLGRSVDNYRQAGITPTLAIVLASSDKATSQYVRFIKSTASKIGLQVNLVELGPMASTSEIETTLKKLATEPSVHGLVLQTPLPKSVAVDSLLPLIPLSKDVDGASVLAAGNLACGLPTFAPATATAVMKLLEYYKIPIAGKLAVVVGRSRVVGKPVASLLLQANATVIICHSHSAKLAELTRQADILVVAAGKPGLIKPSGVKEGAVVIDVGTNITSSNQVVGDVDPRVGDKVSLSPVPGGVGPVTTAIVLQHTVLAVKRIKP